MIKEYFDLKTDEVGHPTNSTHTHSTSTSGEVDDSDSSSDSKYKGLIDELNKIDGMNNISEHNSLDEIKQHIKTRYNNIGDELISNYDELKLNKRIRDEYKSQVSNKQNNINSVKGEKHTNKRLVEINMNKERKLNFILFILKITLVISGCLIVIPLLQKLNILNKKLSLMIWCFCVLILLIVVLYFIYFKNYNRDPNDFNKFNFMNPGDEEIAKSKLNVDLSDEDQARCQAFSESEESVDASSIDIDISQYKTKTQSVDAKCPTPT
jgi:hypothetical protein